MTNSTELKPRHQVRIQAEALATRAKALSNLTVGVSGLDEAEIANRKRALLGLASSIVLLAEQARAVAALDYANYATGTDVLADAERVDQLIADAVLDALNAETDEEEEDEEEDSYAVYDSYDEDGEDDEEPEAGPYADLAERAYIVAAATQGRPLQPVQALGFKNDQVRVLQEIIDALVERGYEGLADGMASAVLLETASLEASKPRHQVRELATRAAQLLRYAKPSDDLLLRPALTKLVAAYGVAERDALRLAEEVHGA